MDYETWEKQTKNQETFSFFILNKMKEEKIKSTDFYKAADLTRDLFSKINCHRDYLPSKITAIKCCLGLRLNISEAEYFLSLAGYSLSLSLPFDLAIRYCIENQIFQVIEVNNFLFEKTSKTL